MLTGERVRLRAIEKPDLDKARAYLADDETRGFTTVGHGFPLREEEEQEFYDSINPKEGIYSFSIETLEDKEYIGGCGTSKVNRKNRCATIGIFIARPFWSQGYGTDAMRVLCRFLFQEMNMRKIVLDVFSFNPRGVRCYEKVGFVEEGRLREEIFRAGEYHDVIVMGLFPEQMQ